MQQWLAEPEHNQCIKANSVTGKIGEQGISHVDVEVARLIKVRMRRICYSTVDTRK